MNLSIFAEKFAARYRNSMNRHKIFTILQYIETHYNQDLLAEISAQIRQPTYYVSRLLKNIYRKISSSFYRNVNCGRLYLLSQGFPGRRADRWRLIGYNNSSYFITALEIKNTTIRRAIKMHTVIWAAAGRTLFHCPNLKEPFRLYGET